MSYEVKDQLYERIKNTLKQREHLNTEILASEYKLFSLRAAYASAVRNLEALRSDLRDLRRDVAATDTLIK